MHTNHRAARAHTLIADDHPVVLFAIEHLLDSYAEIAVSARVSDAAGLFDEAANGASNVVVTDLYMPGGELDGLDMLRALRTSHTDLPIVLFTMETRADVLEQAIALGADAILSKRDRIELLQVAIVAALAREPYLGPSVRASITEAQAARRLESVRDTLSRREFEVLAWFASGLAIGEIAHRLGRSVKTVSAQKCTAMRKLALTSDAELIRFAVERGVTPGVAPTPKT